MRRNIRRISLPISRKLPDSFTDREGSTPRDAQRERFCRRSLSSAPLCIRIILCKMGRARGICRRLSRINPVIVVNHSAVSQKGDPSTLGNASLSAVSIADSISGTYSEAMSYIRDPKRLDLGEPIKAGRYPKITLALDRKYHAGDAYEGEGL